MPSERRACSETDRSGSNRRAEAPWSEPASRSASEPESASLRQVRTANLSDVPKPVSVVKRRSRAAAEFSGVSGGSAQGRYGLGRLGDPCHRFRQRNETRTESIRGALAAGESERPIVAMTRGNARRVKGPWHGRADSKGEGTDWSNPITEKNVLHRRAKLQLEAKA